MSKPINMTEDMVAKATEEFAASLRKLRMTDGKFTYVQDFASQTEKEKVIIRYTPTAYLKQLLLVNGFTSEVAWHGTVTRNGPKEFTVEDILVYPQIVTGVTVNTDQIPYQDWLYNQPDEVFNAVRLQGHSHVDFSTNPSGEDLKHQRAILAQLTSDMFYIFMIWNQKSQYTIKIYDYSTNTLYENSDIEIRIGTADADMTDFLKEAKALCPARTVVAAAAAKSSAPADKAPASAPADKAQANSAQATTSKSTTPPKVEVLPATKPAVSQHPKSKPKEKSTRQTRFDDVWGQYDYRNYM